MVKYYVEITKRSDRIGNDLWAPVNDKIWHWRILKQLQPGDVVYHFFTKNNPSRLIGKSIVKSPVIVKDIPDNDDYYKKGYQKKMVY